MVPTRIPEYRHTGPRIEGKCPVRARIRWRVNPTSACCVPDAERVFRTSVWNGNSREVQPVAGEGKRKLA